MGGPAPGPLACCLRLLERAAAQTLVWEGSCGRDVGLKEVLPRAGGSADTGSPWPPSAPWGGLCCVVSHEGSRERDLSRRWQGWGGAPRPGQTPVCVAVVRAALRCFLSRCHLGPLAGLLWVMFCLLIGRAGGRVTGDVWGPAGTVCPLMGLSRACLAHGLWDRARHPAARAGAGA